jgi:hypothetical protein
MPGNGRPAVIANPGGGSNSPERDPQNGRRRGTFHAYLRQVEAAELESALRRNHWNVAATARELGVTREGLTKRLGTLGIRRPPPRFQLTRSCPRCGALAGEPCRFPRTPRARLPHVERAMSAGPELPADGGDAAQDAFEEGPLEQTFRETMLRFVRAEDRVALVRVGRMLLSYVLDVRADLEVLGDGGSPLRTALRAAARDVRHLASYFGEVAEVHREEEAPGTSAAPLAEVARRCGEELSRIADRVEAELGALPPSHAEPSSNP